MKTLQWLLWQLCKDLPLAVYSDSVHCHSRLARIKNIIFIIRARASRAKCTRSIITHSSRLMDCLYYTYGSTANFLFLGPTALIYILKERRCNEDLCGVDIFKIERVIR